MMRGVSGQNPVLASLLREDYDAVSLARIVDVLQREGVLQFQTLESGLYGSVPPEAAPAGSGYQHVWVRDNVYVAHAQHVLGNVGAAVTVAVRLLEFFCRHRERFERIIAGEVDPDDVMRRPHVRFDGVTLSEIPGQTWSHAQNDALGYLLWLVSRLARSGALVLEREQWQLLALFPAYFEAISFWRDSDNGHWEEVRKISASSIGVVVAGLEAFLALLRERPEQDRGGAIGPMLTNVTAGLAERGRRALSEILPAECVQPSPLQNRRYDAALIFLLHPTRVVRGVVEQMILEDVRRYLTGPFGIRRYLGDSYFAPDYESKLAAGERTRDFSNDIESRDVLLERIGDEAQWCIFDPILSVHHGERFRESGARADRALQVHHLNRALGQVTGPDAPVAWRCPEFYYIKEGRYVPGPHAPLLWTQANLALALAAMRETVERA